MANEVKLTFAGDSEQLERAAQKSDKATQAVGTSAVSASKDLDTASKATGSYVEKVGKLGSTITGASDAIDNASKALVAITDIEQQSARKAQEHARALNDVTQAQEDFNQALQDGKQAAADAQQAQIDAKQANLDAQVAQTAYNDAVKEHGANSVEAQQAAIDLAQAQQDLQQANLDSEQSTRDASQATIDATSAQLDLNEAQTAAHPPDSQKWADQIETVTPLINGLVGVIGLITGAQWAWNAAQLASPTTWIVLAIIALIAVIVLIATKTTWFQDLWNTVWGAIKKAASAVADWFTGPFAGFFHKAIEDITGRANALWEQFKAIPGLLKNAFAGLVDILTWPFRTAFNFVSDAWNNTIGKLSWTVPSWVPVVGGNTISAPRLPHFHSGGTVPGVPGQEVLAVLEAGEKVISRHDTPHAESRQGGDTFIDVRISVEDLKQLKDLDDFLDLLRNNHRRGLVTV